MIGCGPIGATLHVLSAGKTAILDMATGLRSLMSAKWAKEGLSLAGENLKALRMFASDAARNEPKLTSAMQNIVKDLPTSELQGLDFRLKGFDSLARQVATDVEQGEDVASVLGGTKDSVRYTIQTPGTDFAASSQKGLNGLLDSGYENLSMKNSFGSDGYQGINSTWRDPSSGQTFEVQFHTPESFDAKTTTHLHYEEQRLPSTTPDRVHDLQQLQNETFANVPRPSGATGVGLPPGTHIAGETPYSVRPVLAAKPFQAVGYGNAGVQIAVDR